MSNLLKILLLLLVSRQVNLLDNGLALRPPMGWMSWGYYMCSVDCKSNPKKCLNEALILSVADEFYEAGYQEAGYEYIIIDDCWAEKHRSADGSLVPDRDRFPSGMKYIADYIHARGLKFGLYGSAGDVTCMQYPGSRRHLQQDAQTFADWEVDYVKFDGCFVEEEFLNHVYIEFGSHLNRTGRPMVYSCSWPYYIEFIHNKMPDYKSVGEHCNLWRNYHDVSLRWLSVRAIMRHYEREHERMATYMAPGRWNDPDMLVVGTGRLTEGQSRAQLALWALLSAPLLLSCDMSRVSLSDRALLLNVELIAIDQDKLGLPPVPHQMSELLTLWVKERLPKKGDQFPSYAFGLVNVGPKAAEVSVEPADYGLNSTDGYTVMDVFSGVFFRNITLKDSLSVTVPPEDAVLYSLFPL